MRLIYEPTVILAWKTEVNWSFELEGYLSGWQPEVSTTGPDVVPEIAGRICYQSFPNPRPGGNRAYLERILSESHGSVLEHAQIGFVIHGVSRSLTHELIRHKAGTAVSELSQRFVDAKDLGFVVPPKYFLKYGSDGSAWGNLPLDFLRAVKASSDCYRETSRVPDGSTTLERKRIRESARSVLPNCVETHIAFSGNLRAWRNIMEQRGSIHADMEIRRLAVKILPHLKKYAPNVFQDMEVFVDEDGRESVKYQWRKV